MKENMFDKQYLLFDLDGTLTNPKEGITKCVQYALQSCGIVENDLDKLIPFIGPPLMDSFREFYHMNEADAFRAVEKYRERFEHTGIFENEVYEGIPELLKALKAAGKTVCLATSKPEVFAGRILEKYEIMQYFDEVTGSELDGRRVNKWEVIEEALNRLGIAEDEEALSHTVMIGDRWHDINGANKCGLESIGVNFGYAKAGELAEAGATIVVEDMEALQKVLLVISE